MNLLGLDVGSSFIKASVINADSGECLAAASSPKQEMRISVECSGWAEQDPELWWENVKIAVHEIISNFSIQPDSIGAIGISYQMHGLVVVDKEQKVLRPAIIWCDSRAVDIGEKAFEELGREKCLKTLLNSPGNFTASKLKWVKENEPVIYGQIHKFMLPGDYIAMKMNGVINTTVSGLSEGIMWDFQSSTIADFLFNYYGLHEDFIPEVVPTFSEQGRLTKAAADELGLQPGITIAYRAGDQPNNAFSLNVLHPGEIAATAGTSGVIYGVSGEVRHDRQSRVNSFVHVNHDNTNKRLGILLCINGTGILNSWLRKNVGRSGIGYDEMNQLAANVPVGSEHLSVLPFGNGAERILRNKDIGSHVCNLNLNIHTDAHVFRAAQEGIVFAFQYGMDIMKNMGLKPSVIRAAHTNMFLSPIFRETLSGLTGATIELYNTDGAQGAARAAGLGAAYYTSFEDTFIGLKKVDTIYPDENKKTAYEEAYNSWLIALRKFYSEEY